MLNDERGGKLWAEKEALKIMQAGSSPLQPSWFACSFSQHREVLAGMEGVGVKVSQVKSFLRKGWEAQTPSLFS